MKYFFLIFALILTTGALPNRAAADESRPVIILKLDDVTSKGLKGKTEIRYPWQILHEFLSSKEIKYSLGVHCETFEIDHQPTIDWIKRLHESGQVEFWCHGFRSSRDKLPDGTQEAAEFEGSYEEQKAILRKCQDLTMAKLGFPFRAFGPHWSGVNAGTARALSEVPELEIWFYGPRELEATSGKFIYDRPINLENPIFVPDLAKFKEQWKKNGKKQRVVTLQGHPQQWGWEKDTPRWTGFREIIEFLISEGCTFDTPSGYFDKQKELPTER